MAEEDGSKPKGLRRRLLVLRLALIGGASAAVTACGPAAAQQYGVRPRTGLSDADPADQPGLGRGGVRQVRNISDSDPSDPPGGGRGGHRGSGVTDNDPSDQPGYGRGGQRRAGVSDSDPSDAPGRGRRGW